MTKFTLLLIILYITALFIGCGQKNIESNIEKTLIKTVSKFPQLPKEQDKLCKYYKFVRSVIIDNNGMELQLRSTPDTGRNDPQKIIVVINKTKNIYAIPLFSNKYHDYWNFQFDSALHSVKKTNTTFEKELKNCLTELNLYDTLGTAVRVINEMFFSLLHCQQVTDFDSLNLQILYMKENYTLPCENRDSCYKRLQKNWQEIKNALYRGNNIAYLDKKNNRVYLFQFNYFSRKQKLDFNIKTYRLDCIFQMLDL